MKITVVSLLCLVALTASGGEEQPRSLVLIQPTVQPITGNLRVDLFGQTELANLPLAAPPENPLGLSRKSPYIAAGLSLIVPGAGQFYTERYWEAAAFLAADVAAWILAIHFDKKGNQQTDLFQNYADARWDAVKYALFSRNNYVTGGGYEGLIIQGTEGRPPWLRVNWEVLNRMERDIGSTELGRYYSHTLPPHGDQQYYELIGKYQQFYQGWDDADPALTTYPQIDQRLHSSPQPNMIYYSKERGKANDYYTNATTWVTVAIVNHVVNAAYAALSAGWYNSAHAELGMQSVPTERGYTNVPAVKMSWEF